MGKSAPTPPPAPRPPDPRVEIAAQANAIPSAYTPYGSRVYSGNPNVAGSFRYTETLSPEQQRQFDARNRITDALLGRAEYQIPNIERNPFSHQDLSNQEDFRFNPDNPVTNQYWNAQRNLLEEQYGREDERLQQNLANQGLPMGSEAYTESMDDQFRRKSRGYEEASAAALDKGYRQALGEYQTNYNKNLSQHQLNIIRHSVKDSRIIMN